ncbi:MAG: dihydrofolate reductase family protein [Solirubrobacteraceae bacterium]
MLRSRRASWGGAAFAQSLSRLGLVDEYRLILQPVVLGQGLPLFKISRRPCGSSSSTPRHTPPAGPRTSTGPRPTDEFSTRARSTGP